MLGRETTAKMRSATNPKLPLPPSDSLEKLISNFS
jgi:hypothetical protein